jgi:hypothetical protein
MSPEFAAKALMGGHFYVVKTAVQDIAEPADKAFFLLKLTEQLCNMANPELARKVVRRLR